jgi:hypothetical protein
MAVEKPERPREGAAVENVSTDSPSEDPSRRADYRPTGTASTGTGLFPTLKRTAREFSEDNMSDWAAALTYYGLLALFPALIALVSIIGLVGDPTSTTQTVTQIVTKLGPSSAAQTFSGPISSITSHRGAAGILLVASLAVALWSASSYIGAFMRASNVIYETPEGRPFWKLRPLPIRDCGGQPLGPCARRRAALQLCRLGASTLSPAGNRRTDWRSGEGTPYSPPA